MIALRNVSISLIFGDVTCITVTLVEFILVMEISGIRLYLLDFLIQRCNQCIFRTWNTCVFEDFFSRKGLTKGAWGFAEFPFIWMYSLEHSLKMSYYLSPSFPFQEVVLSLVTKRMYMATRHVAELTWKLPTVDIESHMKRVNNSVT